MILVFNIAKKNILQNFPLHILVKDYIRWIDLNHVFLPEKPTPKTKTKNPSPSVHNLVKGVLKKVAKEKVFSKRWPKKRFSQKGGQRKGFLKKVVKEELVKEDVESELRTTS